VEGSDRSSPTAKEVSTVCEVLTAKRRFGDIQGASNRRVMEMHAEDVEGWPFELEEEREA
jgi:hypothetical protein